MLKLISVPPYFNKENVRLYRHAQLLNFFLVFFFAILLYSSITNFFTTDFYLVIAIEAVLSIVCLGAYYWFRTRKDLVITSWVASSISGLCIIFLILYSKGGMDTYTLLLIYPLVVYPLHGIKTGTVLYVFYSVFVVITVIYGWDNWQFISPTATLFNVTITLVIGGGIIYYLENTKDEALDKLYLSSMSDTLTGVWNRKMFDESISMELLKSKRYNMPLSLVIIDIDHFKTINDEYGHHIGDSVLKECVQLISHRKREYDLLYRWGGDEFVLILPNTSLTEAEALTSSLIDSFRNFKFKEVENVSISAGVDELFHNLSAEENFQRIDEFLYQAKLSGKDKFITSS